MMDELKHSLLFIMRLKPDTNDMAIFLQPFLEKINNAHLTHFHNCLQHSRTAYYVYSTVIHQIIKDCNTNTELCEIIQRFVQTFL